MTLEPEGLDKCKICGGTNSRIQEDKYWTGERSIIYSYTLLHWCSCDKIINGCLRYKFKTREELYEFWNN